jgi:hypothetical protein
MTDQVISLMAVRFKISNTTKMEYASILKSMRRIYGTYYTQKSASETSSRTSRRSVLSY